MQEVIWREVAIEHRKKVLSRDSVSGFIEKNVDEFRIVLVSVDKGQEDGDLGDGVKSSTRVSGNTSSGSGRGEKDNNIS